MAPQGGLQLILEGWVGFPQVGVETQGEHFKLTPPPPGKEGR
jgi:hypothetical protein